MKPGRATTMIGRLVLGKIVQKYFMQDDRPYRPAAFTIKESPVTENLYLKRW